MSTVLDAVAPEQQPGDDGASPASPLDGMHDVFREHLYLPDTDLLDFVVAVAVANRLGGDPLWAFVVAPPSTGKTESLQALTGLAEVHSLSAMTENTLLSGAKNTPGGQPPSLLLRLPRNALLLLKDFTTILSMREDSRAAILGQFREVYDGSLVKETGTGRSIRWEGRLGFVAGVTPVIDVHHSVIATLGERFVYFRAPEADRVRLAHRSLKTHDGETMRKELRDAVTEFVSALDLTVPDVPEDVEDVLVALADLVTWARSGVNRDRFTRDIEVAPSREAPGRFVKQVATLWRALTVMGHPDPLGFTRRVALDSMPPARSEVLQALGDAVMIDSTDLRKRTRLSPSAHRRLLEDLEALDLIEIVERAEKDSGKAHKWALTAEGRARWEVVSAGLPPPAKTQGGGEEEEEGIYPDVAGEGGEITTSWADLYDEARRAL